MQRVVHFTLRIHSEAIYLTIVFKKKKRDLSILHSDSWAFEAPLPLDIFWTTSINNTSLVSGNEGGV